VLLPDPIVPKLNRSVAMSACDPTGRV